MTLPIIERLRARKLTTRNVVGNEWIKNDADCAEAADIIEELVEALRRSNKIARTLARGHMAFPDDIAALDASDATLAKIGGGQ